MYAASAIFVLLLISAQLLSISIHTPSHEQVHQQSRRLRIVDDIPNVQEYLRSELADPRRSIAVLGRTPFGAKPGLYTDSADSVCVRRDAL